MHGGHDDDGSGHPLQEDCVDPWQFLSMDDPPGTTRLEVIAWKLDSL